ncbi:unnamed protein product [Aphanomyces euteiches]|uniref:histone deacetylase n=1 Tax=Aphanomyces euteiches TaxID=100861 RepID=A0A6G0WA04_9STRA|nr:hypothetical protein Ae201684_017717 [Aphanomyces euteiches]KAH9095462.1 hypothetical protein Ae201684P_014529 [Aphanomyces euteiches]KAH9154701.1 hypothetical protein AeRB84_003241 [Aphanomyces euteiches]
MGAEDGGAASPPPCAASEYVGAAGRVYEEKPARASTGRPTTFLYSHPSCIRHHIKRHPERPERVQVILERLQAVFPWLPHHTDAPPATIEQLQAFHTPMHVQAVLKWCAKIERSMDELDRIAAESSSNHAARRETLQQYATIEIDGDTALMRYTREAAVHAAGAACAAVDAVLRGDCLNAFCAVRPPGHHAEPHKAMGFCIFNNIGIAAMHALETHKLKRVAVLDFDVHHGNGTETKAKSMPQQLFYLSTHQSPFFPHSGHARCNAGNVWNFELTAATSSATFRRVFQEQVEPQLHACQPQLIFISAGFDGHKDDPLAQVNLTADDYEWVTQRIKQIARLHCHGRIVSVLEGGYSLRALADCVEAHVGALLAENADETDVHRALDMTKLQLTDQPREPLRLAFSHQSKQKAAVLHTRTMDALMNLAKTKMGMKKRHVLRTKHGNLVDDAVLASLEHDAVLYMS